MNAAESRRALQVTNDEEEGLCTKVLAGARFIKPCFTLRYSTISCWLAGEQPMVSNARTFQWMVVKNCLIAILL